MRVTFCLRSLAIQGGSVNTRNVATERLAKSDKPVKISHSVKRLTGSSVLDLTNGIGFWFAFVRTVNILTSLQPLEKMTKLKQKRKSKLNLNSLRDK